MSASADANICRTASGSKSRSIRVLALDTDASVVENTIFSAACQMPVVTNAREAVRPESE